MSMFDLSRVGDSMNGWAMWAFKKFCGKGLNLELHGYKVPNWWKRLKDYGDVLNFYH